MHVEIRVGKTTRVVMCQLCQKPIELGALAAYYSTPPKGSAHIECHLGRKRS
jgi:hypothetical protein